MMKPIRELAISQYRGVTRDLTLTFDPKRPLVVIFGENGTGKTTIVDAIDLVTNGEGGSIRDKGVKTEKDLVAIGAKGDATSIALTTDEGVWRADFRRSRFVHTPEHKLGTQILRRANVQKFIEETPGKKYEAIQQLLGVTGIEKSEATLRTAIANQRTVLKEVERRRDEAAAALNAIWNEAGAAGEDAESWARALIDDAQRGQESRHRELLVRERQLFEAQESWQVWIKSRDDFFEARRVGEIACDAFTALTGRQDYEPYELVQILGLAHQLMHSGEIRDRCPVCEQPVKSEELLARLDERMIQRKEVFRAEEERRRAVTAHSQLAVSASINGNRARDAVLKVDSAVDLPYPMPIDVALPDTVTDTLERVARELASERAGLRNDLERVERVRGALTSLDGTTADCLTRKQKIQRLEDVQTIVRRERHAWVDQLLQEVVNECNRMYASIHPEEGLAFSSIRMDPKERSSLVQAAHFRDRGDVLAQAVYSEGHLDTLGFCFWLAYAKHLSRSEPRMIVIDDVFSAVDDAHMGRIGALLFEESRHFAHVIVVTHSRLVRSKIEGPGRSNQIQTIELSPFWDADRGVRERFNHSGSRAVLVRMTREDEFERLAAVGAAGVHLEELLDCLASTLGFSMQRSSRNEYTLTPLLEAAKRDAKRVSVWTDVGDDRSDQVRAHLGRLQAMTYIRNQVGAHFNPAGLDISDTQAMDFARTVLSLSDLVCCAECGQVPGQWDVDRFRCRCSKGKRLNMRMDR